MRFYLLAGLFFLLTHKPCRAGRLQFPVHTVLDPLPPWPESLGRSCWEKISLSRICLNPKSSGEGGTRDERHQATSLEAHPSSWWRSSLQGCSWPGAHLYLFLLLPWPVGFVSSSLMGLEVPLTLGATNIASSGKGTTLFMIGKFLS